MLHSGIATTVLLVATRYLESREGGLDVKKSPFHLEVPAIDRDATPATHGDAVHDCHVRHSQLADRQV